jgi:hypothetical protein
VAREDTRDGLSVAGDLLGDRLALSEDLRPVVATNGELHRHHASSFHLVEGGRVVNQVRDAGAKTLRPPGKWDSS